jgi:hypothetical protein
VPHYDDIGHGYTRYRRPDPRIARAIQAALGDARSVVNVGAGEHGQWTKRNAEILGLEELDLGYRLVVGRRAV